MLCECLIYCTCVFVLMQSLEKALNQTYEKMCGQQKYVSTNKLEAVTINKLTEIPPANNITNL
jgi:hypothetical protein